MKKICLMLLFAASTAIAFAQTADSDGDGVLDSDDLCPMLAGPASNKGCPQKDSASKNAPTSAVSQPTGQQEPSKGSGVTNSASALPAAKPPDKCFPSGTSLVGAGVSEDGAYVRVNTVRGGYKYFDTRTHQLIAASTEFFKEYEDQYLPRSPVPQANYFLEITERPSNEPYFPDKTFRIKNKSGDVLSTYETTGQITSEFDPTIGALLIWLNIKQKSATILVLPGKEPKRIYKDEFIMGSVRVLSPDRRYIVTDRGVIIDLKAGKVVAFKSDHSYPKKQFYIGFRSNSTEFFVSDDTDGIITYSCETGKRLSTVPIPADLPRIEGFTVVPATNGNDFLYYMNFRNKTVAGLAYWVKDGAGASLCDPAWQNEQSDNWVTLIKEAGERIEREEAAAAEAARKKALDDAQMDRNLAAQAEYRRKQGEETRKANNGGTAAYAKCAACNGTGTVMQNSIAYHKTTREYSSGAGSSSVNYRVTSTPVYSNYAQPTTCRECSGSGRRKQ